MAKQYANEQILIMVIVASTGHAAKPQATVQLKWGNDNLEAMLILVEISRIIGQC